MKRLETVFLCIGMALLASSPALAIEYHQDPVFVKPNAQTPHPLEEVLALGGEEDVRAAFILGDLYEKGKGGMPKNAVKSQKWFEQSALGGYPMSFVRLAAKAKNEKKFIEAYQWYSLALDYYPEKRMHKYLVDARNNLIRDANLGKEDIKAARQAISVFEKRQKKILAEKRAQERKESQKNSGETKTQAPKKGDYNG